MDDSLFTSNYRVSSNKTTGLNSIGYSDQFRDPMDLIEFKKRIQHQQHLAQVSLLPRTTEQM